MGSEMCIRDSDYALARDPDTIINDGTQPFNEFFDANPALFGERTELLVNIIAYTTKPKAELESTDGEG